MNKQSLTQRVLNLLTDKEWNWTTYENGPDCYICYHCCAKSRQSIHQEHTYIHNKNCELALILRELNDFEPNDILKELL